MGKQVGFGSMWETVLRCPVCGAEMDRIQHPDEEVGGMGLAMLGGDGRRDHAIVSPECTEHKNWHKGWDKDAPVRVA
jgi:hypothetical protein